MPASQTVTATAPGKLILMGEHAAVYGRPAVVAAFGLHTRATLIAGEPSEDDETPAAVRLELPDIGVSERTTWDRLVDRASRFRSAWERARSDPASTELAALRRTDPARIVKLALAESLVSGRPLPPGMELRVVSELPVGSGFGSSASVAVAVSGALQGLLCGQPDRRAVERAVLEVERREHGRPSGIDHGTVLDGGVQWMESAPAGGLVRRRLAGTAPALEGLAVFDTGSPAESTGEVVAGVASRFAGRTERLESILAAMEHDVGALRQWLLDERREPPTLVDLITDFERRLEELGVVPRPVRELVRRLEAVGGAAKISGAGALSGSAAGSLLVYHPERPPHTLPGLGELRSLEAELGVPGLWVESSA